jgi:N-acetylmuramoyl-L-alanine amidase
MLVAGFVLLVAVATALTIMLFTGRADDAPIARQAPAEPRALAEGAGESLSSVVSSASTESVPSVVEVPDVIGMSIREARAVLTAAGLVVSVDGNVTVDEETSVSGADPKAGSKVAVGSPVVLIVPVTAQVNVQAAEEYVICIDPGHQAKSDLSPEPIGPGASETKDRVRGGATGTTTRIPEYEITLQIAMNLKEHLEAEGVTVVMTRDANDVNVSNAERAQIANAANADLFIRIHADGNTDPNVAGVSTLYPGSNRWTEPISVQSEQAARTVHAEVLASTGAVSRGVVPRTDLSGFNWSEVPAVLVECGFMSNPVEDRLLASPHYQTKLAAGMASGILKYLEGR